jgi:hypothetical protein
MRGVAQFRRAVFVAAMAAVAACASSVDTAPTAFIAAGDARDVVLTHRVEVQLPTRYTRVLSAGGRWRHVGNVAQGHVYRPVDTVFTIEGRHVHEAYLVVAPASGDLIGFYLPGESTFSALPKPVQLTFKELP